MTDEPQQRREHDRKQMRGSGRFSLTPSAVLEVRVLDISPRTVAIVSASNLPIGSNGTLHLTVPNRTGRREWFEAHATVVASVLSSDADGFRLSLRLDAPIPEALSEAIERFVAS